MFSHLLLWHMCSQNKHTHTDTHTLVVDGMRVSRISLYTGENWPNSPNYGITWANLIHQRNYPASAATRTHTNAHGLRQTNTDTATHACCDNRRCWSNALGHLAREEERLVLLCLRIPLSCSLRYLSPVILLVLAPRSPLCTFRHRSRFAPSPEQQLWSDAPCPSPVSVGFSPFCSSAVGKATVQLSYCNTPTITRSSCRFTLTVDRGRGTRIDEDKARERGLTHEQTNI